MPGLQVVAKGVAADDPLTVAKRKCHNFTLYFIAGKTAGKISNIASPTY